MRKKINLVLLAVGLLLVANFLNAQSVTNIQQGRRSSIRGLSVLDDSLAWLSGSNGYVAKTFTGGKLWNWQCLPGYEKADFRGITAFSAKEAIVMSSGAPSVVLKTTDGGASWHEKYRNEDTLFFFDAMAFADSQHGFILGDPIKGRFVLLETKDGGETWKSFNNQPRALPGEAAFAASNSCLRVDDEGLTIVSGSGACRELKFSFKTRKWTMNKLPFNVAKPSQGAFSIATSQNTQIIVGGDYADDKRADAVTFYGSSDADLAAPVKSPGGFQSSVEHLSDNLFLSTGTPGTHITKDGGKNWMKIDDSSFNVCAKAKHGSLVILAGNSGKTGVLQL